MSLFGILLYSVHKTTHLDVYRITGMIMLARNFDHFTVTRDYTTFARRCELIAFPIYFVINLFIFHKQEIIDFKHGLALLALDKFGHL